MTKLDIDYDRKFLNSSTKQLYLSKEDERFLINKWQLEKDAKSLNKIVLSHLSLQAQIFLNYKESEHQCCPMKDVLDFD